MPSLVWFNDNELCQPLRHAAGAWNFGQSLNHLSLVHCDRLSRLDEESGFTLKEMLNKKELKVISLDLPTSHIAFSPQITDEFTGSMIKTINNMMMDMLAAIARKDYQDRRRRQADQELHEKIYQLRVINKLSISDTAKLTNVSTRTVIRVAKKLSSQRFVEKDNPAYSMAVTWEGYVSECFSAPIVACREKSDESSNEIR